jgi:hypothetical protein
MEADSRPRSPRIPERRSAATGAVSGQVLISLPFALTITVVPVALPRVVVQ